MTLVGDLLQKVNALESRLATYRNHVRDKETPGGGAGAGTMLVDGTPGVASLKSGGDDGCSGDSTEGVAKARVIESGRVTPLLSPGNVTSTSLTVIQPGQAEELVL